ncbi:PhzF family phenazine biosynthesis protein [Enterococcus sp. LJL51]|uniref:PhzF family phenazine biosynthesis protein n=1 Tax=Enterococcus sp. LJL51 TaxID=3416656 RepID=UPI003CFABD94
MIIDTYSLNAFTKNNSGGNPAGVVLDAKNLAETEMQKIASILGFSETAFLFPSVQADFQVRYFTPVEEVPICGHATVGLFSALLQKKKLASGSYSIETKAGILTVNATSAGEIFLQQTPPQFLTILSAAELADSLGLLENDFHDYLPVQIVSTGLKDILIQVKSLQLVTNAQPNFPKITAISQKYQVTGYHLFSTETVTPAATAHCRNFAPLFDIPEESATGTSNAALACYLSKYQQNDQSNGSCHMIFEQGYSMGLPSEIQTSLTKKEDKIREIFVGGKASSVQKRLLSI